MKTKLKGSLYLRNKTWWLSYSTGEKKPSGSYITKSVSLHTDKKEAAELKAERLMAPLALQDEAESARAVADAAQSLETRALAAAKAAETERTRIPLAKVWDKFPYDYSSPRRGARRRLTERNIEENRLAWAKFANWCATNHPGAQFIEDVTPDMAREYSKWLIERQTLTAGRHNKLIITAGVMFRRAGRPDPFASVSRFEVKHESRANLEPEQMAAVCSSATGELRRLFAIAFYTGMRLGDCALLEWKHIRDGIITRVMAKTHKEISFPIHTGLQRVLAEVAVDARGKYVCPELAEGYLKDHVLISRMVRKHFENCKITCVEDRVPGSGNTKAKSTKKGKTKDDGEDRRGHRVSRYGFHSFRHSFITECARGGVPMGIIRDWVGHSSVEITKIYEHWGRNESAGRILNALPTFPGSPALPAVPGEAEELRRQVLEKVKAADLNLLRELAKTAGM